jgi:uncharacterized membrane protein
MVAQGVYGLSFAKQSAKGTAATTATYTVPLTGGDLRPVRSTADVEETTTTRLRAQSFVQNVSLEGEPEYAVRLPSLGLLLYAAMGAKAVTGASDPYTHTFTLANSQPWMTFWRMAADLTYERMVDVKTNLTITSEAGQPVRASFSAQGLTNTALSSAAYTTALGSVITDNGDVLMHYDGAGAFQVETVAVSSIERIVISINNNYTLQQGDSITGYDVSEGMRDITIETTQAITDAALYNRYHYGSASPSSGAAASSNVLELASSGIDFKWTQVAAAPGPERSLQVTATKLQVTEITGWEPGTGNDPYKQNVTYKVYQPSSGSGLTAVLKNGTASY